MNRYIHDFITRIASRSRPRPWQTIPAWSDLPPQTWYDWHWQWQHRIRSVQSLYDLGWITETDAHQIKPVTDRYALLVSPYYLSLSRPKQPKDPIYRQAIPSPPEVDANSASPLPEDPFDEQRLSPVPGLIHRYPDRVLLIMSNTCTTFCRHCFRKRILGQPGIATPLRNRDAILAYIRSHPGIRDVILSGGDPLTLSTEQLANIINALARIPHVRIIRLGTRVPVTLPMRLWDDSLLKLLHRHRKIWVLTHFNHPRELTLEARFTLRLLQRTGCPVLNQSVLLRGINDRPQIMLKLLHRLVASRVIPYYLHHADPVAGTAHFRTSIETGLKIIGAMRGQISGFAIPTYVVDLPHGGGKVPVTPQYLIETRKEGYLFRNPQNQYYDYPGSTHHDKIHDACEKRIPNE